jgi:hypothetical protein
MPEKRERWMDLAAQVADEQNPEKFTKLIQEIDRLLEEKQERLNPAGIPSKPTE